MIVEHEQLHKKLDAVRTKMREIDSISHTSLKFQDDLLSFICEHAQQGTSIVEIGCYRGGLTAQLALVAKVCGLRFDVIDIDHKYLNIAAGAVQAVALSEHAIFHAMDFTTFVRNLPNYDKPVLVFDDGDHRYDGVVADIRAIKAMGQLPYACAFHDFSLRYADGDLVDVRVDKAIIDEFGDSVSLTPIGETVREGGSLKTVPTDDRHYHEIGKPEGVIVTM